MTESGRTRTAAELLQTPAGRPPNSPKEQTRTPSERADATHIGIFRRALRGSAVGPKPPELGAAGAAQQGTVIDSACILLPFGSSDFHEDLSTNIVRKQAIQIQHVHVPVVSGRLHDLQS